MAVLLGGFQHRENYEHLITTASSSSAPSLQSRDDIFHSSIQSSTRGAVAVFLLSVPYHMVPTSLKGTHNTSHIQHHLADIISLALVDNNVAACVTMIAQEAARSTYRWKGVIHHDEKETILLIKSTVSNEADIIKIVREIHPYDVPELLRLPVQGGFEPYLGWVQSSVRRR